MDLLRDGLVAGAVGTGLAAILGYITQFDNMMKHPWYYAPEVLFWYSLFSPIVGAIYGLLVFYRYRASWGGRLILALLGSMIIGFFGPTLAIKIHISLLGWR